LYSLAFSPDGRLLASAGNDRMIKLWDVATGQEVRTIPVETQDIFSVTFSPDSERIASTSGHFGRDRSAVKVWEVATGQELLTLKSHSDEAWFLSVAFAPVGDRLASAGTDGAVTNWDTTAGAEVLTLTGHTNWVNQAVFSPDGTRLATAGRDRRVIIWEAKN